MTAEEYFTEKPEPTFLEENPKSCDDYDREMLQQFCYDANIEDDEIDDTVQSLIDWKNKRSDEYADIKAKEAYEAIKRQCTSMNCSIVNDGVTYEQWKEKTK